MEEGITTPQRLKRSVWSLPVARYPGAHFAVFPETIPTAAILAGTSAAGCCRDCGAPWKRLTKRTRAASRPGRTGKLKAPSNWDQSTGTGHHGRENRHRDRALEVGNRDPARHITTTETIGWQPTCRCGLEQSTNRPCVVLDPFLGSGTTGRAARKLRRKWYGIELSTDYSAQAEANTGDEAAFAT